MSYFHAKVQFLRQQDNGLIKKVAEQYLVDAMSWTETESRVMQEVGEGMREVTIVDISRSPVQEVVFYGDTDLWFKCKVAYRLADEESEKEKKITIYILVNANDAHQAYERCGEHLKGMLVPFEIPKVEETAICDIYQYEKQAPKGFVKADLDAQDADLKRYVASLTNEEGGKIPQAKTETFTNSIAADEKALDEEMKRTHPSGADLIYGAEFEIPCEMEDEAVSATICDPTQGQAVAFADHSDLVDYLRSIGKDDFTISQLDAITHYASEMLLGEFSDYALELGIERKDSDAIWSILNDK